MGFGEIAAIIFVGGPLAILTWAGVAYILVIGWRSMK